ncbi:Tissue factor pathway inhibitor [Channa argus]|uniref:Tissue factor pathway inhibitor n=1 Tax=Channa argus TaxID=215402 RepID=A0A6G1PYT7_CHAAH|nr:Tissue factor pathway inhibitor [Channa argus]
MALTDKWRICCVVLLVCVARLGSCRRARQANEAPSESYIFQEFCALKDDPGPCKAIKERFFFNVLTTKCEPFEYGGCQGNNNNFQSLEQCEETCFVSEDKNPCHLPEAPGPCRGLLRRYFFDSESQQCKLFYYGGCFGNANKFMSLADCQRKCQNPAKRSTVPEVHTESAGESVLPTIAPKRLNQVRRVRLNGSDQETRDSKGKGVCFGPVDRGTCDGAEMRFAYNPETKKCEEFVYSGCGGNENNFSSKKICFRKCIRLKKDHGFIRIKRKNLHNFRKASA